MAGRWQDLTNNEIAVLEEFATDCGFLRNASAAPFAERFLSLLGGDVAAAQALARVAAAAQLRALEARTQRISDMAAGQRAKLEAVLADEVPA